jgi:endonuclease/exonuclease/phosphatase family metal-dependent hydrolase
VLAALPARAAEIAVMTFNVRYGTASDGPNSWKFRKEILSDTVRQYSPDILGLQECLDFQAEFLASSLPDYAHFGVGRESDGTGERMEIFYKKHVLAPLETGNYWLSETPGVPGSKSWNSANVRMVTWARFYHYPSGKQFFHFNTHLDHRSEEARRQAAKMLAEDIRNRAPGKRVIVTGDFNSVAENSEPWNTLIKAGFKDTWMVADRKKGPEITWSGFKAPEKGQIRRIDWILILGDLKSALTETVTFNREGQYPSDHFPVFSRIYW